MNDIYCIMLTGFPLTDETRNWLFKTAQEMAHLKENKAKVKTFEFEGFITTQWLRKGIGSTFGIEFLAEIDTERGSTKISYIVQTKHFDTDDGEWVTIPYSPAFEPLHLN